MKRVIYAVCGMLMVVVNAQADCAHPNEKAIATAKAFYEQSVLDNYAVEKYGHDDQMAIVLTKAVNVSPHSEEIAAYIKALIAVRLAGCVATHFIPDKTPSSGAVNQDGRIVLTNTLLCSCAGGSEHGTDKAGISDDDGGA